SRDVLLSSLCACRRREAAPRRSVTANPVSTGRARPIRSTPDPMRVAFAADHAGAALKDELRRRLAAADLGHEIADLGGDGLDPLDDYPDFAAPLRYAGRARRGPRGTL